MDGLLGPVFGGDAVVAATGDRALLGAMCAAEAALAAACAAAGLIEPAQAAEIVAATGDLAESDPAELGRAAVAGGNPVIPLVTRLRELVGPAAAAAVHLGATSQDILDTALVLVTRQALRAAHADLVAASAAAAHLARTHRSAPMAARTLMQQAVPTTFGALAAVWGAGLDRAATGLTAVTATLPAQLGGAAGTLAGWYPHGFEVVASFAGALDLAVPDGVWHAERTRIAELAGALGATGVAVGKVAADIVLLAQTELGEVREAAPGGSSAMPHKHNPIAAITARAAAAQLPGLVSTLLAGAGSHELQRAAGGWHAEWPALVGLLRAAGGAAGRLRVSLTGLHVDTAALARNLDAGAISAGPDPDLGHAVELVDRYLAGRAR